MNFVLIFLCFISTLAHGLAEEKVKLPVSADLSLSGYISRPSSKGQFPALVLQMGHGRGTTDSPDRSYNPFAELARNLASHGFVVLRFDKRGTGYNSSHGSFADGKFSDYVNDLEGAVRYVQKLDFVDESRVYLFGHSLGGPVVSILANRISEIKGIILSASPGRSFADFNLEQMKYYFEMGMGLKGPALNSELKKVKRASQLKGQPEAYCQEFPQDCTFDKNQIYIEGQSSEFWKEIAALDPIAPLKTLNCHIFAIHGTSDWVVSSHNDGGAISQSLRNHLKFSKLNLEGLDHFLLKTGSKKESVRLFVDRMKGKELAIHPEFIPEIIKVLTKWDRVNSPPSR